jgi:SNF2 family DNA or RNA helicase
MEINILKSLNLKYMLCPHCEEPSPHDSVFCIACGKRISEEDISDDPDNFMQYTLASDAQSEGDLLFNLPKVELQPLDETIQNIILHKRQKIIELDGLPARLLSFLLITRKSGNIGLKSLAQITIEPRPYQIEAALSILDTMGGSGILADEVGLGKTIEAGIVIKEMIIRGTASKVLILVPASLLSQWREELEEKFLLEVMDETSIDKLDDEDFTGILLLSLHKAKSKKIEAKFLKVPWDLLVVDEAHSLKNHLTLAHRFVFGLKRKYTMLLTATPVQNDLRELYNLINVVKPGYFKSIRLFRRKYMVDRFTPRNPEELRRFCSRVMVRHRRTDTLIKLPPREVRTAFVTPSAIEKEFYNLTLELARRAVSAMQMEGGDHMMLLLSILLKESTSSPQALLSTLEAAVLPKIVREQEGRLMKRVLELGHSLKKTAKMEWLLGEVARDSDPIIVYTEYLKTQTKLQELLEEQGHLVHRYAGNLRLKDKELALKAFRSEGGILLSTEVGGQGLNLQHCHRLVNFDLPWNPMKLEQRIGRIHRFGQQEKVQITTIAGKGTFEEYLVKVLLSKIKLFEMVIGEIDSILSYLKNPVPLEKRISRIILESTDTESMQTRLDQLAKEIISAKQDFNKDQESSAQLLDLPA